MRLILGFLLCSVVIHAQAHADVRGCHEDVEKGTAHLTLSDGYQIEFNSIQNCIIQRNAAHHRGYGIFCGCKVEDSTTTVTALTYAFQLALRSTPTAMAKPTTQCQRVTMTSNGFERKDIPLERSSRALVQDIDDVSQCSHAEAIVYENQKNLPGVDAPNFAAQKPAAGAIVSLPGIDSAI